MVLICTNIVVFVCYRDKIRKLIFMDVMFFATILILNTGSELTQRLLNLGRDFADISASSSAEKQAAMDSVGSGRGELWRYGIQFALEKPIFAMVLPI